MSYDEAIEHLKRFGLSDSEAHRDLVHACEIAEADTVDELISYSATLSFVMIKNVFGMRAGRVVAILLRPEEDDEDGGAGVREPRKPVQPLSACGLELDPYTLD